MSINSRTKGRRGESQLAAALTVLTGRTWRRTAQRRGTATADVEADGVALHVECKRINGGLQRLHLFAQSHPLILLGDLWCCELHRLHKALTIDVTHAPETRAPSLIVDAMKQANRDRLLSHVPLVCARQDGHGWLACWQWSDDDALREVMEPLLRAKEHTP